MMRVTIDDRTMRRFMRQMPAASERSQSRALNKAITRTRTLAAREVSAKRNVTVKRARDDMRLVKATAAKPGAAIVARGAPIGVIEVKGVKRQTKRGVTAKITAKERPHLFKGAFIAKTQSGHVGVFQRLDPLTHKSQGDSAGTTRFNLPIRELTLPSVASTMVQPNLETRLRAFAWPVYEAELMRLLNVEMRKAGAR